MFNYGNYVIFVNNFMTYLFKQKFDIRELVEMPTRVKKILIAEPEEYLLALYTYHLSNSDYFVKPCRQFSEVSGEVLKFAPHLLIINANFLGSRGVPNRCLQGLRRHNPSMFVLTVGQNTDPADLKSLMAAGSNAHIDRRHSRPEDITAVVRTLLQ
jgi:DNA-binding response OmpR family regulator